jgi:hypothetical protein
MEMLMRAKRSVTMISRFFDVSASNYDIAKTELVLHLAD